MLMARRVLLATRTDEVTVKVGNRLSEEDSLLAKPATDSFKNEREAMLRLYGHPHVIQALYGSTETITLGDGNRYNAMSTEVAHNGDLFPYVQLGTFDEILARTYFKQLLIAVKAAHGVGVYHRDLKPENILLSMNFKLKLGDFGHAYVCNAPDEGRQPGKAPAYQPSHKRARTSSEPWIRGFCGSPGYIAPEVSDTTPYLGSAADVWSAGCVLFIMLVGHSAFELQQVREGAKDPWLQMLAEGKYKKFWRRQLKYCDVNVSHSAIGEL
jgi:serine/threonine protein kinase